MYASRQRRRRRKKKRSERSQQAKNKADIQSQRTVILL